MKTEMLSFSNNQYYTAINCRVPPNQGKLAGMKKETMLLNPPTLEDRRVLAAESQRGEDSRNCTTIAAAGRTTPDRGRVGRVASGGGRVEAPASRDRRRVGRLAPRDLQPRFQR